MKIKRTLFSTEIELKLEELYQLRNIDPELIRGILSVLSGRKWGYGGQKKGGRTEK